MQLSELLNYDRITIQCHDNPDPMTTRTFTLSKTKFSILHTTRSNEPEIQDIIPV